MEFEGVGRCLKHEPGRLYSFKTEGGADSTWTYHAVPDAEGTRLAIQAEYEIPDNVLARLPSESVVEAMKKSEAERVSQNLKVILDR